MVYLKKLLYITTLILVFVLLLSLWGFYWAIRPLRITSSLTPDDFGVKYEKVSFLTQDNVVIRGWFIPNANPHAKTIILLHGYPADKGNILPSRLFLHKKYHLLFIDFRYLGESGGSYTTIGKNETLDLLAAIQYLNNRGIHEVGIWGFSLGGAVALMTAPFAPEIKALIAESSYARLDLMAYEYFKLPLLKYPLALLLRIWGRLFIGIDVADVSPMQIAKGLTIPVLIMHSKQDDVVPYEQAELFKKVFENKPNVQFYIYDRTTHGEAPKDYEKRVSEFFDKNFPSL